MRSVPIRDFTTVETIYRHTIRTVKLKVSADYIRSRDMELQTIGNPDDVHTILRGLDQLDVAFDVAAVASWLQAC